jgi:hypothetical protein
MLNEEPEKQPKKLHLLPQHRNPIRILTTPLSLQRLTPEELRVEQKKQISLNLPEYQGNKYDEISKHRIFEK